MTQTMDIDALRGILIDCAGGDDVDALRGDIRESSFEELGYDSLALMETAARLKRDHGVVISDERLTEVRTPVELLVLVNDQIAAVAGHAADG
ncbi:acyl carrier protein [Actinocorallia longicatena]|uniref:Acyl carrier protein n=1 Tax=Actinocorallia longicatena TaxID=111803 RepID=A0ABP6Q0P5_9ACTN